MRRATNQKHGRRDDEPSDEEDGSEDEVRVSNAQRGRVRLHRVPCNHQMARRSTTIAARAQERRAGPAPQFRSRWWRVVWSRGAFDLKWK